MSNAEILNELVKKFNYDKKANSKINLLNMIKDLVCTVNYDCATISQKKNILISNIINETKKAKNYVDVNERYLNIIFDTCMKIGGIQAFDIIYSVKDDEQSDLKYNPRFSIFNGDLSEITVHKDTPNIVVIDKLLDYLSDPNSLTKNNEVEERRSTPSKELILINSK